MGISKVTIFIGLFFIVSASFSRQLMDFAKAHIEEGFVTLIGLIFAVGGMFFLIF